MDTPRPPKHVAVPTDPSVRQYLPEPERQLLASYLAGGAVLFIAAGYGPDAVSGEDFITPMGAATDGEFTWSLAAAHYVEKYGLAPQAPDVLAAARAHEGRCPHVSAERCEQLRGAMVVRLDTVASTEPSFDPFAPHSDEHGRG